jgi:hypothetical protein
MPNRGILRSGEIPRDPFLSAATQGCRAVVADGFRTRMTDDARGALGTFA